MKKLIYGIIAVMMFLTSNGQSKSDFKNDPNVQEFFKMQANLILKVTDIKTAKKIIADGKIDDQESKLLLKLFGFNSQNELEDIFKMQNDKIVKINETYNITKLDSLLLNDLIEEAVQPYLPFPNLDTIAASQRTCAQRYNTCIVAAGAAAIGGHCGCATIDWTPGGIVCHASIIVLQICANEACSDAYDDCNQ